ncbi:DUF1566 domain-containing protein [Thermodesulfobacteriota bacterium]
MRKTIVIGISLLFFIGIVSQASAKKIHCWDFIQNNECDIEEDINGDGKCNGRDCKTEEQCYAVPQTGQTGSFETGDDGDLEMGIYPPAPRFTDNLDGTITDNLTNLMWLQDANCIRTHYPSFDNYGTLGDGRVTWKQGLDFIAGINNGSYPDCGSNYTDWRLPNVREMLTLINYGFSVPALSNTSGTDHWIENDPFTNVMTVLSADYWTSTTFLYLPLNALVLVINFGTVDKVGKTGAAWVWPMRGGD